MNYQIKDSYKITSITEITSIITELWNKGKLGSSRSIMSYVKEWHAHNILYKYGIAINSTKDADLNDNESKFRLFCYEIIWIFTHNFKKYK